MSDWIAEVERLDPRVQIYAGAVYSGDPELPENRDQTIDYYRWSGEDNTWLNNVTGERPPKQQADTLSYLVANSNALGLSKARAKWNEDEDEPELLIRKARLSVGGASDPRYVSEQVQESVDPRVSVDATDQYVTLIFPDEVPTDQARANVKAAMSRIASLTGGSGLMNPEDWK